MGLRRAIQYLKMRLASIEEEVERQHRYFTNDFEPVRRLLPENLEGLRALDVGCGNMLPATISLTGLGMHVTGIDIDPYEPPLRALPRRMKQEGKARALSMTARNMLIDGKVQRGLAARFPHKVRINALDVRVMDAAKIEFPDNTFDLIFSTAVFEHIENMPAVLMEVYRVLKPGSVGRLHAHLWTSRTGSHTTEMMDERGVPLPVKPWDHLLNPQFRANCYLNFFRDMDYRRHIEETPLDIVDWVRSKPDPKEEAMLEGELGEQLEAKGYSREELLTTSLSMIVRKPAA